ncbi:MAG: hypothetical protein AAB393_15445, partial [Bacteroidota bacterium]
ILRWYALALLRRNSEEDGVRKQHVQTYGELMEGVNMSQAYFRMLPDYAQLRHAFEWTLSHDVELAYHLADTAVSYQENFNLVRDVYDWACRLQKRAMSHKYRHLWSGIWLTLANALRLIADLPNENQKTRLLESLAAYDQVLNYLQSQIAPIMYPRVQSNRAIVFATLAGLPGENQRDRLQEGLAALEDALRSYQHDVVPEDYAGLQNNRASILSRLAGLPEEDRHERLLDSLDASNKALEHCHPQKAPLDYAMVQLTRGWRLHELASVPGEQKHARLIESLNACNEALRFYQPHTAPYNFRKAQILSTQICRDLAQISVEDRRTRLLESLAGYEKLLANLQPGEDLNAYVGVCLEIAHVSTEVARYPNQERKIYLTRSLIVLDQASQTGLPDIINAKIQRSRAMVLAILADFPEENRQVRLLDAIRHLYTTYSFFEKVGLDGHAKEVAAALIDICGELGESFSEIWDQLKLGPAPEWVLSNWKVAPLAEALANDRTTFVKDLSLADKHMSLENWHAAAQAGNRLLDNPEVEQLPVGIEQLRAEVARCWNNVGSLLLTEENEAAKPLSAFNESARLQPNNATYYRNRARTHVALGNIDAAQTDWGRAVELEPEYPWLTEFGAWLMGQKSA